jgi:hypothetical protein
MSAGLPAQRPQDPGGPARGDIDPTFKALLDSLPVVRAKP